ncbi:MAG TPA: carbohydrate porin [Bacteroidales bacterium]|nr:carbohydrate porin [Bacteroidales bacterium]
MKRLILSLVLAGVALHSIIAQERENEALTFEASFLGDVVSNFKGGIKEGQTGIGLIHLTANLNTDFAKLWKGGNFFIHAHHVVGGHPSEQLIGDIQVASNIDGFTNRFIYELWYSQNIRNVTLFAGLHNLNDVFHVSENASVYLNSSFGISPSLSLNNAISIYPVTTLGGVARWDTDKLSIVGGLYNFGHAFAAENQFNIKNHVFRDGFFSLFEVQYRIKNGDEPKAEFKFGITYKRCANNHAHFTEECPEKSQYSSYFLTDYTFFKSVTGKCLAAFVQTGYSPGKYSYSPFYLGTGVNLKGFLLGNHMDELAIAFATARINHYKQDVSKYELFKSESLIELTYKIPLYKRISLQPDLQYIINPAGAEGSRNAFVGLLRTEIVF